MSNEHLIFWNEVSKTDPSATKTDVQGGRKQTSINGYYMIQKATEMFGMAGVGWGWEVLEERWDDGALITIKTTEGERLEQSKTHTVKIKLWFKHNGQKGEIIQYGHTQAIYRSKYGVSDDGEAPKKSLMDAIKKSLSMLGFSADVFTGMYDDQDYVERMMTEESIEKAIDKDSEIEKSRQELISYIEGQLDLIKTSATLASATKLHSIAIRHLEMKKKIPELTAICEKGITAIARANDEKKATFKEVNNGAA